ncbi:MAG: hypothetical protein IJR87_03065 [Bacteroidaceae bacterium]|nr:hypothetical protein [Bacteroidaceae bacterium]
MKKTKRLFLLAACSIVSATAFSQVVERELGVFNHLSAGIEVGTTGFGVELAAPATRFVTVRTGFTMLPAISFDPTVHYTSNKGKKRDVELKTKLKELDWKLLADVYPIPTSSFHLTAGFYLGKSNFIDAENKVPLTVGIGPGYDLEPNEGLMVGNYLIEPNDAGFIKAHAKVGAFKPYLGVGFGRPVSKSGKLVSCAFDLGVQFWGKPKLEAWAPDDSKWAQVKKEHIDDEDFQDVYDIIRKICVYPVLNFRLYFNCF